MLGSQLAASPRRRQSKVAAIDIGGYVRALSTFILFLHLVARGLLCSGSILQLSAQALISVSSAQVPTWSASLMLGLNPVQIAVSPINGYYYFADNTGNQLVVSPGAKYNTFGSVDGVAIDLQGDAYISDAKNNKIWKLAIGGSPTAYVTKGIKSPQQLAVDAAGAIYVLSLNTTGQTIVMKIPFGSTTPALFGSSWSTPSTVFVSPAQEVYVGDAGVIRVYTPAGVLSRVIPTGSSEPPASLAMDGIGSLYTSGLDGSSVLRISANGERSLLMDGCGFTPRAFVLNGGFLYGVKWGSGQVFYMPLPQATGVALGPAPVGNAATTSLTICAIRGPIDITLAASLSKADENEFTLGAGDCTMQPLSGTRLSCTISLTFMPSDTGAKTQTLSITATDNLPPPAGQITNIALYGTGTLGADAH